jgi:hypothetical protein
MSDIKKLHEYIKNKREDMAKPKSETKFYLDMFEAYEGKLRFASWNWPAFLFGGFWLLYRKMYLYVFFDLIFFLFTFSDSTHNLYYDITSQLVLGIFGNSIYRYHLRKRVKEDSNSRGTSWLLVILAILVVGGIVITWKFTKLFAGFVPTK